MNCKFAGSWAARRRAAEGTQKKAEDEAEQQQKKKRKRRVRLPKGFDPANPGPMPNPERWLPKWQRSDFKKKRTRRKEKVRLSHTPLLEKGSESKRCHHRIIWLLARLYLDGVGSICMHRLAFEGEMVGREQVCGLQEAVKGSQGAGKVDEALDRSNVVADAEPAEAASRPGGPQRNKKKGRR